MSSDTAIALPTLALKRLRFLSEAIEPIRLPAYSGSAWRGVLGRSLRESVCVTRQPICEGCLLRHQCAYSTFFESPPASPEHASRYSALPHPFVLEPEPPGRRNIGPREHLQLGITLVGPAGALTPYLIHALQRAGQRGLGRDGGRFRLASVEQETVLGGGRWQRVFDADSASLSQLDTVAASPGAAPPSASIVFETPVRLKRNGRYTKPHGLDAGVLLGALVARVDQLDELYGSGPPGQPGQPGPNRLDRAAAFDAIQRLTLEPVELHWVDWTRYSSRQRTRMQLGGLVGTVRLSGDGLQALWPLVLLGQWLHVGKATSFGLGRYRVVAE
jgi:hypothetical protein